MGFRTPADSLTIAPDRSRLLMSESLHGRSPALRDHDLDDDEILDDTVDDAELAELEKAEKLIGTITLVVERFSHDDEPCHLIGALVSIDIGVRHTALSLRVELADALAAAVDADRASNKWHLYAGAQIHRGENDAVIRLGPGSDTRKRLARAEISDITPAGMCTLTVEFDAGCNT